MCSRFEIIVIFELIVWIQLLNFSDNQSLLVINYILVLSEIKIDLLQNRFSSCITRILIV
jgi:hypothetical protein